MGIDIDIPDGASVVAVLLHPHPDMGGDRHNHVIGALYLGLPRAGFGAACFDFSSSGSRDVQRSDSAISRRSAAPCGGRVKRNRSVLES